MSPVLRVSRHIYGVSKEIDGKTFILRVNLGMQPIKLIISEIRALFWGFNTHLWGFQGDRWENVHFESKPRHVTPQINCLRKLIPVLRVSTHLYGVSKEIDGKTSILIAILRAHIGRSSGRSNPPRSASSSEWPFLISIVKAHTIKWQIYPDKVFYAKDLLPMRVTT